MSDSARSKLQPESWLEEHGDVLYRYALARTGRRDVAQDLVQETLLAAWQGQKNFLGDASERSWLVGICRHKIIDHFRQSARRDAALTDWPRDSGEQADCFKPNGSWRHPPGVWDHGPLGTVEAEGFLQVLQQCMAGLPAAQRECFELRELAETPAEDAGRALGVSLNHLYVLLHRARLALRRCLEKHWFAREASRP